MLAVSTVDGLAVGSMVKRTPPLILGKWSDWDTALCEVELELSKFNSSCSLIAA